MGYFLSRPKLSTIAFIVSQTFFTLPVFAAGFQINEVSTSLQGDALAGAAAANNDVSAMFINPATLATLRENQVYVGGSEILPTIHLSDATAIHSINVPGIIPTTLTAPVLGSNSQHNVGQGAFIPHGYASWRFNDKLAMGIAVVAPFGLKTHYDNDSVLRFIADYSTVKTIDIVPSISYAINDQWAVGVGFQAQYLKAILTNFDGPYSGVTAIDALIASNNQTWLEADGWGYGYTLGVLFKPDVCTRIGLGYRSMISEQLSGHGQQYIGPGATVPAPTAAAPFNAETSVKAGIRTPAVATLSAARDMTPALTVKATAQLNFWHTLNQLSINMPQAFATNSTITTKWKNSWFGSIGAEYRTTPAITVRGGIAYDETPTTQYRDPRIPDSDRYWLNIGATYKFNKNISIDGTYAHLFIHNQSVNVTEVSGTTPVSQVPLEVNTVSAKYRGYADIVALAVRFSF